VIECPEHAASIQERFHDDQSFLEMGRDYAEALDAWRRWQTSDGPQKAARIEDYRDLATALESEIVPALAASAPRSEGRPDMSYPGDIQSAPIAAARCRDRRLIIRTWPASKSSGRAQG
jgi:hypothetical protein